MSSDLPQKIPEGSHCVPGISRRGRKEREGNREKDGRTAGYEGALRKMVGGAVKLTRHGSEIRISCRMLGCDKEYEDEENVSWGDYMDDGMGFKDKNN